MELYFTCPATNKTFASADYKLADGYHIESDGKNNRQLLGEVALTSPCPLCGQSHTYAAQEVLCPYDQQ